MVGLLKAKRRKRDVARCLGVGLSTVYADLKRGPPGQRVRRPVPPSPKVLKRQAIVRACITKFVVRMEQTGPTLNRSGAVRKNSRKKRVQTRQPLGSLSKVRRHLFLEHGIEVSKQTIHRDVKALGLVCRRRGKGPGRYEGDEAARLQFAKDKLTFARKSCKEMLFADEKIFDSLDCNMFCYGPKGFVPPCRERERFPAKVLFSRDDRVWRCS